MWKVRSEGELIYRTISHTQPTYRNTSDNVTKKGWQQELTVKPSALSTHRAAAFIGKTRDAPRPI